ncbi:tRNA (guanosine(37)-N1)-methyltransferase TrmD [Actinomyces sp.]
MRFDLISIFPDYFAPLTLSLMGKAEDAGLVTLAAHDLRQWATGKHRSVDDTPYGGGAGMVMRADVWARALDDALATPLACENAQAATASCRRVLAIPTPSGTPLTQPVVEDLARADQIIVACGRYEGIDARVAQHYRAVGVEVLEFSIGDYVLNGGEVAAMVLTEAVARLLDGFMGNPDSLVEESHSGAGLLEYPVFTKPREFRSLEIPEVLLGGNHAAIERWRRDRAIEKTAAVRPDLALELRAESLGCEDRATLAACGVAYPREGSARPVSIRHGEPGDAAQLSVLASRTFPEACPPELPRAAIDAFIAAELGPDTFEAMLADSTRHRILVAQVDARLVGYALIIVGEGAIPPELVRPGKVEADAAYLSKCYVDAPWRGSGIADALVEAAASDAAHRGHASLALGTNRANKKAQAFYKRHGFRRRSTRTFDVGGVLNHDVVMVRDLTPTGGVTLA